VQLTKKDRVQDPDPDLDLTHPHPLRVQDSFRPQIPTTTKNRLRQVQKRPKGQKGPVRDQVPMMTRIQMKNSWLLSWTDDARGKV